MLKKSLMLLAVACMLFSCAKEELVQAEPEANFRVIFTSSDEPEWRTGDDDEDGDDPADEIIGSVEDDNGNGISNVEVQLDTSDGGFIDTDYTDGQGDFKFENLSSGDYKLRVKPNTGNEEVYDVRIN